MLVINLFCAIFWFGLFISLFFGFSPDKVLIGLAFLTSSLYYAESSCEIMKKKVTK